MGFANGIAYPQPNPSLFSFGVISDVQYADIPDGRCSLSDVQYAEIPVGRSFLSVPRYYRYSIHVLQRAVKEWNNHQELKLVLNLRDIVDGFCPKDQSLTAVNKIVEKFSGPVYHMIGNHCLYNLPRDKLLPLLKIPSVDGITYYDLQCNRVAPRSSKDVTDLEIS